MSLGIINECHRLSVDYAKSRKLWGKEIAQFQLVQLKLAEMEIARMNVQNMVFNAIERAEAGDPVTLAERAGLDPDPWQRQVLTSVASRLLLNCSRQSGKWGS